MNQIKQGFILLEATFRLGPLLLIMKKNRCIATKYICFTILLSYCTERVNSGVS